jgi:hypothetical protein
MRSSTSDDQLEIRWSLHSSSSFCFRSCAIYQSELPNSTTFVTGIVIRIRLNADPFGMREIEMTSLARNQFSIHERNRLPIFLRVALYVWDLIHFLHAYVSLFSFRLNSVRWLDEEASEIIEGVKTKIMRSNRQISSRDFFRNENKRNNYMVDRSRNRESALRKCISYHSVFASRVIRP